MNRRDRVRRLGEIQRVMDTLRQPGEAPDLAQSILARVHEQREFVPPTTRRWVGRWRLAAAAGVAGLSLAVACAWRWAPEATTVAAKPTPVSNVLCVGCRAAEHVQLLATTIERAGETQPAEILLAITAEVPAADEGGPSSGRVAALPCPVPPCSGLRQGLVLPREVISLAIDDVPAAEASSEPVLTSAAPWPLLFDESPGPVLAAFASAPRVAAMGADPSEPSVRATRPLAESLAPMLWGRPSRASGAFGSGLPK